MEHLDEIDPQTCRNWAMSNFSMEAVYPAFNQYFEKCAAHFVEAQDNYDKQWYLESPNYENTIWNYQKNYEEFTKTHILMVCNNPFVDMALKSLTSFASYHTNYDITIIDCGLSAKNKLRFEALNGFNKFLEAPSEFMSYDQRLDISQSNTNPT
tara:strand:+ start:702 stop:1163 length:462 start_codon:yes stop_codon:yes gene_type:complete